MASFDENGKYIKTNWKAGDKITATKLNKIEESIEAVNDNDISRHVEADARLDALEAKDVAHDKELTNIKNTIADNKAAAELGDYDINSRMTFLENELNEGIEEVHNVANTVDGKIATAEANMTAQINTAKVEMTAQVNKGKADMEAMVAEVEGELESVNSQLAHIAKITTDNLQNDINDAIRNNQNLMIKNDILSIDQVRYEGTGIENININCNLNTLISSNYNSLNDNKGVLHFENLDTVKISNLKMEYTNRDETLFNYHNLLDIRNCKNVIIENCQFNNSLFAGLSIDECQNVIIRNTKASGNYHGGLKYANSKYILIDGCDFSDNGWSEHQNKGYGVTQEGSKNPCDQVIITNSIFNNNVRKGIDCHEFYNVTITNNELNGNGICGIALQNNAHNAGKVIISNNIVENQPVSGYTTEGGIDVVTVGDLTVDEIIISNNIIKNVCCRGIGVAGNGCNNVLIENNIVNGVVKGGGTGACLKVEEVNIPCKTVKVVGNTFIATETANILIEQCEKLFIENNYLDNVDDGNGISLHFPNKYGDIEKIPYAVIQGNVIKFSGLYFENGWKLRGAVGAITNNRHECYTFKNNTVTNSNGTTYQLWEQTLGIRTITTPTGLPSACSSDDWVIGDKVITSNHISTGYTGKICIESGSPGTWAYFGKIDTE